MRKWIKPQLIVLARGTPEERVLEDCKTSVESGIHPSPSFEGCFVNGMFCAECEEIVSS